MYSYFEHLDVDHSTLLLCNPVAINVFALCCDQFIMYSLLFSYSVSASILLRFMRNFSLYFLVLCGIFVAAMNVKVAFLNVYLSE